MTCDSHCGGCGSTPMGLALPKHNSGEYNVSPKGDPLYGGMQTGPSMGAYASNVQSYVSSGSSSYIR
ncbi:hypothetical protein KY362_02830 [Candidatus Woesearchaeota archaeon]|nr:hypothetical protein [Candidatus Woesearchaeota archaeon]